MFREYTNLNVTSITPEQHEKTCGYNYLVTHNAMSHTAFETRAGLDRWMRERNLKLKNADAINRHGEYGTSAIIGTYREISYLDSVNFYLLNPHDATPVMSNGDYTLGLITENFQGIRTVHYLNPNVRTRMIFASPPASVYG